MAFNKRIVLALVIATTLILGACASDDDSDSPSKPTDTVAPEFSSNTIATPVGATAMDLHWDTASDDVTLNNDLNYEITLNDNLVATVTGTTQYTLTELAMDTLHTVFVTAVDAAGNRTIGNTEQITTGSKAVFTVDIQPVLKKNCTGSTCHGSGNVKEHNMDFTTAESAYTSLMGADNAGMRPGVTMDLCPNGGATTMRIVPNDLGASMLLTVVDPNRVSCAGDLKMPPGLATPLSAAFITVLENWITDGNAAVDVTPLTFNGVTTFTPVSGSATQLVVKWDAATDNVTVTNPIHYLVYAAPQLDPKNLGVPRESLLNITETTLKDLLPNTEYTVMVVAVSVEGNSNPGAINTQLTAMTGDTVSFALDIKPTLQTQCGPGCHDKNTTRPKMDLLTDSKVYAALVGTDMEYCPSGKRIVANDVANSLLIPLLDWTTNDTCNNDRLKKMPKGGLKPSKNFLVSMKSWIMAGALNN